MSKEKLCRKAKVDKGDSSSRVMRTTAIENPTLEFISDRPSLENDSIFALSRLNILSIMFVG